jgi:hypothetical protein
MAFHPPVHPEFVLALRILDAVGLPYAEAWRLLRPVAARLGIPRPSYSSVRRIVIAERERQTRNADELDRLLADLLAGRFPYVFVEHKLIGLAPGGGVELPDGERLGGDQPRVVARPGRTRRWGRTSPASLTLGLTGSASGGAPKERRERSRSGLP